MHKRLQKLNLITKHANLQNKMNKNNKKQKYETY